MLKFEELPKVNSERWLSTEDLDGEVWKDIKGYEGLYQISCYGRVKSFKRNGNSSTNIRRTILSRNKRYYRISLNNVKQEMESIHRLVLSAFCENKEQKPCVDHINTNTFDNRLCNLRWVTYKENSNNPITAKKKKEWGKTRLNNNRSKSIIQLSLSGEVINEYPSINEASRITGISKTGISRAIRQYSYQSKDGYIKTIHTAGGYKWDFKK